MKVTSIAMSFKAKINNYAKKSKLPAQVVLQNFMFERFLERLSVSEYQDKFVIKGGMLISVLVGLETRSTMDLDATLKNINLSEENITSIIKEICDISIQDSVFLILFLFLRFAKMINMVVIELDLMRFMMQS